MKKTLSIIGVSTMLLIALVSSLFLLHTTHAQPTQRPSLFALEHQHGKASSITTISPTFSCVSSGGVAGNRVINVTEKVTNDADSGQAGNYWGLDTFSRTIKVWNIAADQYCIVVKYTGTFAAKAGQQSPGTTATTGGILTGDEIGKFSGGYQAAITGPLFVSDPSNWPLTGLVKAGATIDYGCVINPDGTLQVNPCPGFVDWTAKYFDTSSASFSFSENPWGWTYIGKDCCSPDAGTADGVWHNFSTGNLGVILDVD